MTDAEAILLAALAALWLTAILLALSWSCLIRNRRERAHQVDEIEKAFVLHKAGKLGEAADVLERLCSASGRRAERVSEAPKSERARA